MQCAVCKKVTETTPYTFWCCKRQDIKPGIASVYEFSAHICKSCVSTRRVSYKRVTLLIAFIVMPVLMILATVILSLLIEPGEKYVDGMFIPGTRDWGHWISVAIFVSLGAFLFFAMIFVSWVYLSRDDYAGKILAIRERKRELEIAGYTGFWLSKPSEVQLR